MTGGGLERERAEKARGVGCLQRGEWESGEGRESNVLTQSARGSGQLPERLKGEEMCSLQGREIGSPPRGEKRAQRKKEQAKGEAGDRGGNSSNERAISFILILTVPQLCAYSLKRRVVTSCDSIKTMKQWLVRKFL